MESSLFSVLRGIYERQPVTRRVLGQQVGLSLNRVSVVVAELVDRQLVREEMAQEGAPGRPAAFLSLNPGAGRVVGLDIGGRFTRAVLTDLTGQVLAARVEPTRAVPDREVILADIAGRVREICREGGLAPEELVALGAGVSAIVDPRTGQVLAWPSLPAWTLAWSGLPMPEELGRRLGTDLVVVDDSVRAMGMAAARFGPARDSQNFLYVLLGGGIGSAVFIDGRPYRGSSGLAGELGHVTIVENGPWCSCGNRGCLEMFASTTAVVRQVQQRWAEAPLRALAGPPDSVSLPALLAAARAGDKVTFQVLDETGAAVGKVLAIALNLLGPDLVVLGGPLTQDGGIILDAVQRQVRLRALQAIANQTRLVYDDQGELVGARGAALLALDRLFSSEQTMGRLVGRTRDNSLPALLA